MCINAYWTELCNSTCNTHTNLIGWCFVVVAPIHKTDKTSASQYSEQSVSCGRGGELATDCVLECGTHHLLLYSPDFPTISEEICPLSRKTTSHSSWSWIWWMISYSLHNEMCMCLIGMIGWWWCWWRCCFIATVAGAVGLVCTHTSRQTNIHRNR